MTRQLLVLFDGNAIVHRAFHALPALTVSRTGEPVGAVYGFASMLLKVINELRPTHYAVAFDLAAPTFRHQMFAEYKAQRPRTPDELVEQLGRVRQLVETFHMPVYELEGYEADDVLGTLSRQAAAQQMDTVIVTGDADAMQLVDDHVKVLYPRPRGSFSQTALYDEALVTEKYGVSPGQIADLKALKGDPSDNIPGVPGVGDKTAVSLLKRFGSLEEMYVHVDEVAPSRLQAALRENEPGARQGKVLATIVTDAPVTLDLDACRASHYDRQKLADLFRELEFSSLLPKLPVMVAVEHHPLREIKKVATSCHIVNTIPELDQLATGMASAPSSALDTETDNLDPMLARLVGISIALVPGEAYYIPVGHTGQQQTAQLPLDTVRERMRPLLENRNAARTGHNANYDMTVMGEHGINISGVSFDTMIAAHLLGEKQLSLKAVAFNKLGIEMTPITALIGSGARSIPMSEVDIGRVAEHAGADADVTAQLAVVLADELRKEDLWHLFSDVEMPLVPVLVAMQRHGISLDTGLLGEMSRRLGDELQTLESSIYSSVGHEFNINSSQQLSAVLYQDLHLPRPRKTRGGYTTEAAVLEELKEIHPVAGLVLEYRQLAKLKSTYVDALPGLVNPKTGRLHTSFNQTKTATGRLSSSDPNLQNIPIRGEQGRTIRKAFVAPSGCYLLAGDYSQIDLRALAHLSRDAGLMLSFLRGEDIHAATAAQLFGVDASAVTADMRRVAKTVNFGVIYGISEYGLEQATELSREEASRFIAAYFEKHPGVRQYIETTLEQARGLGYVHTILGRRRYVPEVSSNNRVLREAAERMAINMPVQGTSADIVKVAMIDLYGEMVHRGLKSKMLLQVHDELIFEVPEAELAEMQHLVPHMMSSALTLDVPVKVDVKVGRNWGEME